MMKITLTTKNLVLGFLVCLIGQASVSVAEMKMQWDEMKGDTSPLIPVRRRIFPVIPENRRGPSKAPQVLTASPEKVRQRKAERLILRLGLPLNQLARWDDQFIITLLEGDEVKLKMDGTYSVWTAKSDEAIRLVADGGGIHTIVCEKESSPIFKTTFSSDPYFVVTSHPRRLGIFHFEASEDPQIVYSRKAGARIIEPWSKIPYQQADLTRQEENTLVEDTHALAQKFDLNIDEYEIRVSNGQAVVSLKKGTVLRVKPGYVYQAVRDNDIQLFVDPLNVNKGFHTLQIKRSSLPNMKFKEEGEYLVWSYNKKNAYLTYHALMRPKQFYTPLDYAVDLFEPLDPES